MFAMQLDFESRTDREKQVRADPRIYPPTDKDWPLSRLAKIYGIPFHKFLDLVLHFRGVI